MTAETFMKVLDILGIFPEAERAGNVVYPTPFDKYYGRGFMCDEEETVDEATDNWFDGDSITTAIETLKASAHRLSYSKDRIEIARKISVLASKTRDPKAKKRAIEAIEDISNHLNYSGDKKICADLIVGIFS